jgi:hypothetical protein
MLTIELDPELETTLNTMARKEAIETTEIIHLPIEDQQLFAESIINPPKPSPYLIQSIAKYHELLGIE